MYLMLWGCNRHHQPAGISDGAVSGTGGAESSGYTGKSGKNPAAPANFKQGPDPCLYGSWYEPAYACSRNAGC